MDWGYGMGGYGWLMMTGLWVVLIAVLAALAAWIFPRERHAGSGRPALSARELLDHRLARGEIDPETYRSLRDELSAGGTARRDA